MKTYTYANAENSSITVTDGDTTMTVPADPGNRHYAEILAGIADGSITVAPYVAPPPPVPQEVTPLQMRKALRAAGLKSAADVHLATLPEEQIEAWEYAVTIMRADPFIESARVALGMSEEDADALFTLAASL
jgi:hypothetical protein